MAIVVVLIGTAAKTTGLTKDDASSVARPGSPDSRRNDTGPRQHGCMQSLMGRAYYSVVIEDYADKMGEPFVRSHEHAKTCQRARELAKMIRLKAISWHERYKDWLTNLARRLQNPTAAILYVFGSYGQQALAVASCESGRGVYAQNGQFLGMFQMGSYARQMYGHSWTALGQAKAAYRYFVDSGRDWSPWSCKP